MSRNKLLEQEEARQAVTGWRAMHELIAHVERGGTPEPDVPTIMCRRGETQFGSLVVDLNVYTGADVEYSSSTVMFGGLFMAAATLAASAAMNANRRSRAEAAARAQWRQLGRVPAIVTNQRILLMTGQWNSYHFDGIIGIEPNPMDYSVALHFEGLPPMSLRGPWVPWATVAICGTLFGSPWPPGHTLPLPVQA